MGDKFRDILEEAAKEAKKADSKKKREGKMLKQLHVLDDRIEDFIDSLEDEIIGVEGNPVFVKKAHQLLADMSKEYSEFIVALRAIVNAVDRKEKVLPAFEKQESRVRDVLDGQGNGPMDNEEPPPEGEEEPAAAAKDDEYELKVAKKGGKKGVKEALMGETYQLIPKLWQMTSNHPKYKEVQKFLKTNNKKSEESNSLWKKAKAFNKKHGDELITVDMV
jgi:hypothetical protein